MSNNTPVDQSIREEVLNTSKSFILQAPAGSGKTELLTQRMLALLATVNKPESVLAITFTRKAAAEMRQRLVDSLLLAQSEPSNNHYELTRWKLAKKVLQMDQQKKWNLIANPNRLNILTIDALSARISNAAPLLCQLGTLPSITENAFKYYTLAAEAMLNSISDNDPLALNIKALLAYKDNNLKQVVKMFAQLLAKRLHWLGKLDLSEKKFDCQKLVDSLHLITEEKLHAIYSLMPLDIIVELPALLSQASEVLSQTEKSKKTALALIGSVKKISSPDYCHLPLWKAIAQMLLTSDLKKAAFYKTVTKANGFPTSKDAKDQQQAQNFQQNKDQLKQILEDLKDLPGLAVALNEIRLLPDIELIKKPKTNEQSLRNSVLQSVVELLPVAVGHLKLAFHQFNVLDFNELSIASLQALGSDEAPSDMALALNYQIDHILIDEFQDTSSLQNRLLELMIAGWDESCGKTLFLVGDPMQSIYRFRDANVSLFIKVVESGLGQIRPHFRQLTVNFRSKQTIVDWVNQHFTQVMPVKNDLTLSAVSYSASTAFHRQPATYLLAENKNIAAVTAYATIDAGSNLLQAKAVVKIVQQHLDENAHLANNETAKTLAILVRSRNHLTEIIEQLNRQSIIYQAVEIESLFHKSVVKDVTSLALALVDGYDILSWVACLRAPWFGILLDDIAIIIQAFHSNQEDFPSIIQSFMVMPFEQKESQILGSNLGQNIVDQNAIKGKNISQHSQIRIAKILPILNSAIQQKGRKPFVKWLSGCFEAVGGLLQIDISSEYQDVQTCIETIADLTSGGEIIDREELQQALEKLYAAPNPNADQQVQIMTIHKSKGLEFDRVILPRLDSSSVNSDAPLLKWTEIIDQQGYSHNLLAISKQSGKKNDAIYQYISYLDRQKEQYENQRILYVAVTRAKSQLYLFANLNSDTKKQQQQQQENTNSHLLFKRPTANSFFDMLWDEIKHEIKIIDPSDFDIESRFFSQPTPNETNVIVKMDELAFSKYSTSQNKQDELKLIFPSRKTKITNIDSIEALPSRDLFFQSNQLIAVNPLTTDIENTKRQTTADPTLATLGVIIHQQLEWLSKQTMDNFSLPAHWRLTTRNQMIAAGLSIELHDFEYLLDTIMTAIKNTLNDDMGRFILSGHPFAKSEAVLHKHIGNQVVLKRIVDRTFVIDNIRWIIDYKSSQVSVNESKSEFIKKEIKLYREQIIEYIEWYQAMETRKIKAGLYFPMLPHFEEIKY